MALKNKSQYAILGILKLKPCTGYDIKTYSDRVLAGFWNENFGHIYPTLKTMLSDGLIELFGEAGAQRKTRYAITEKGRRELESWLGESTRPQPQRSEFLLKLLFSSGQPADRVADMLMEYRALHKENRDRYRAMQEALSRGIPEIPAERARFIDAILRNGVASCETAIRWCDETIEEFRCGD